MEWSKYTLDQVFTGRSRELDLLAREFLGENSRVVAITGGMGIGKTALALMFAQKYATSFPAGTYHINTSSFEPLRNAINSQVSHPGSPYLLILDNLDKKPTQPQQQEIAELRMERPSARILCLSRDAEWFTQADFTLKLGGLVDTELHEFLKKLGFAWGTIHDASDVTAGSPLFAQMLADNIKTSAMSPREIIESLREFHYSGLLGPDGRPLGRGTREEIQIVTDLRLISDDLLKKAHANPSLLYEITPRRFEEFVADILARLGYDVTLTPASKDGGKDIFAAKKDDLGTFLYFVECKRYAPDHKVDVTLIRELFGVVQAENATAGILATTSSFTRGAQEFQARRSHQITLRDYVGLQQWMNKALKK